MHTYSEYLLPADQRLQKLVRQINAKWAAEIVQSLVKANDVHQMAQLLENEQRLKEQVSQQGFSQAPKKILFEQVPLLSRIILICF